MKSNDIHHSHTVARERLPSHVPAASMHANEQKRECNGKIILLCWFWPFMLPLCAGEILEFSTDKRDNDTLFYCRHSFSGLTYIKFGEDQQEEETRNVFVSARLSESTVYFISIDPSSPRIAISLRPARTSAPFLHFCMSSLYDSKRKVMTAQLWLWHAQTFDPMFRPTHKRMSLINVLSIFRHRRRCLHFLSERGRSAIHRSDGEKRNFNRLDAPSFY